MEIVPIHTRVLTPPKDDLLGAVFESVLTPTEGDCIAVTSKVVSIWQGRCVPMEPADPTQRDTLAKAEAEWYLEREYVPGEHALFTITDNMLVSGAGIDASNAQGNFILLPRNPMQAARELLKIFKQHYGVSRLALIITDSRSLPLRRGAIGSALGWAGFDPLVDHRNECDLFGRPFAVEHTNLADALAATAVLAMGETDACTPLAVIRNVPYLEAQIGRKAQHTPPYEVRIEEDIFAPFLKGVPWKKGGGSGRYTRH